jgi:hypothetical protein
MKGEEGLARALAAAVWRKSSHSGSQGGNCVEVAAVSTETTALRDSKNPQGGAIVMSATAWRGFLESVKLAEFDRPA